MVIQPQSHRSRRRAGILAADLAVALGIIVLAIAPITLSWLKENRLVRNQYYRAIAMQIVDGGMEILAAGAGQAITPGTAKYDVTAAAAGNLPPGKFTINRKDKMLQLSWTPQRRDHGGQVIRKVVLR
jgi:hypothetical protein